MKKLLVLFTLLMAFNAAAESFSHTFFGAQGRNRIYLSCYYVERAVDTFLDEIGATDITTTCTGGIDYGYNMPVSVRSSFTLPTETKTVEIKSDFNSNCYFDTEYIRYFVQKFDNVKKLRGSTFCSRSESPYKITLQIN